MQAPAGPQDLRAPGLSADWTSRNAVLWPAASPALRAGSAGAGGGRSLCLSLPSCLLARFSVGFDVVASLAVSKKPRSASPKKKTRARRAAPTPSSELLVTEIERRTTVDDLLCWSGRSGLVAEDLLLKYYLLLDDRHARQAWLDQIGLDDEARQVANNLMGALRDAVPWAIRAIEGHLVGPGRSEFSRQVLRETATRIYEAITKESFQMAEARGVPAVGDLYYQSKARHEAQGYLALHRRLKSAKLDEAWILRLAAEVKDHDPDGSPWPEALIHLGNTSADVLRHRRLLNHDDVQELLTLIGRRNEEWVQRISDCHARRVARASALRFPADKKERLVAANYRLLRKRWAVADIRKLLAEAMDLAAELAKLKHLRVQQAWKIASRRVPLKKVSGDEVTESMRLQIIRTSPEKLRAAMEESTRTGSKQPPRSGSRRRT